MFTEANHEVYLPNSTNPEEVLSSTTNLAIATQQDDIEIMAIYSILQSLHNPDAYFSGCVVTVGHGLPVQASMPTSLTTNWRCCVTENKKPQPGMVPA